MLTHQDKVNLALSCHHPCLKEGNRASQQYPEHSQTHDLPLASDGTNVSLDTNDTSRKYFKIQKRRETDEHIEHFKHKSSQLKSCAV